MALNACRARAVRRRPQGLAALPACLALVVCAAGGLVERLAANGTPAAQLLPGQVRALAAGKLLIAARGLPDPNFARTVVLLADFNREGAMGLVINRRTEVALRQGFPQLAEAPGVKHPFYFGGPVAATGVLGLLRSNTPASNGRHLFGDLYLLNTREPLEAQISAGTAPARFRVYLGYAGWGPGQLEHETALGSWHVLSADVDVVFDSDPDTLWERQIRLTEGLIACADCADGGRILRMSARSSSSRITSIVMD